MLNLRVVFLVGLFAFILLIVPFATAQPGSEYYLYPVPLVVDTYPYTVGSSVVGNSALISGNCFGSSFTYCGLSLAAHRNSVLEIYGMVYDFVDYDRSDSGLGWLVVGTSSEFNPDYYGFIQLTTEEEVSTSSFVPYRWCSTDIDPLLIDHLDCDKYSTHWYDGANGNAPSVQNINSSYIGTRRGSSDFNFDMQVNLYWLVVDCPVGTEPDPAGVCSSIPTPTPSPTSTPVPSVDIGATCGHPTAGQIPANLVPNYGFENPILASGWTVYPGYPLNANYWGRDSQNAYNGIGYLAYNGEFSDTALIAPLGYLEPSDYLVGAHVHYTCDYDPDYPDDFCFGSWVSIGGNLVDFPSSNDQCSVVGDSWVCDYQPYDFVYSSGGVNAMGVGAYSIPSIAFGSGTSYIDDVFVIPVDENGQIDCNVVIDHHNNNPTPTPYYTPVPTLAPISTLPPISTIVIPTYGPGPTIPAGVGLTPAPTTCINFDPDVAPAVVLTAAAEYANVDIPSVGVCYAPQVIGFDADNPIRAIVQPETMLAVLAPAVGLLVVNWIRKR